MNLVVCIYASIIQRHIYVYINKDKGGSDYFPSILNSLEEEVFFLGKTDVQLMDKLTVISCMKHEYASYCFSRHTISSFKACTSR